MSTDPAQMTNSTTYAAPPPGIDTRFSGSPTPPQTWGTSQAVEAPANPCRLIVNYLPSSLTADGFRSLFAPYGTITSYKLVTNKKTGASLGYGFIEYTLPEEAEFAIHNLNRRQIENKVLKVSYARNPSPEIKNANMYVSGLHQDLNIEGLEQLFRPFGTIITSNILKDQTGRSRCVGFVRMSQHSEAVAAVHALNGQVYMGKTLTVKIESTTDRLSRKGGSGRGEGESGRGSMGGARAGGDGSYTLFVYGIPTEEPDDWVRAYFAQYGEILRLTVPTTETGQKKQFAFVTYKTFEQAAGAINALNGASVGVGGKTLQVSFKTEKNAGEGRGRGGGFRGGRGGGRGGYGAGFPGGQYGVGYPSDPSQAQPPSYPPSAYPQQMAAGIPGYYPMPGTMPPPPPFGMPAAPSAPAAPGAPGGSLPPAPGSSAQYSYPEYMAFQFYQQQMAHQQGAPAGGAPPPSGMPMPSGQPAPAGTGASSGEQPSMPPSGQPGFEHYPQQYYSQYPPMQGAMPGAAPSSSPASGMEQSQYMMQQQQSTSGEAQPSNSSSNSTSTSNASSEKSTPTEQ
ncbi:putative ELAV protein [Monocercomonoides exilis]|uniref:putative ELAV protein n=1 Tax=Monocercomonoides exilis TaxID=2049356 RepID=UPI00355998E9|nr:putative ELAV protein [Monocercomonoides exilis]